MLSKINSAQDRHSGLQQMAGRLACILALVVNIATTVGIVCTIFRLGLHRNPPSIALNHKQEDNQSLATFTINQDLSADSLVVHDTLRTNSIRSEQISIVGKSPRGLNAEININPDYISMQSSLFGPRPDEAYTFKLAKRLEQVEVPHGLNNVRAIRSIVQSPSSGANSNQRGKPMEADHLQIRSASSGLLELSGNLGVRVHSEKQIEVSSDEAIGLASREGGIVINTGQGGLRMPSIEILDQDLEYFPGDGRTSGNRYQLCYHKNDGLIYQTRDSSC